MAERRMIQLALTEDEAVVLANGWTILQALLIGMPPSYVLGVVSCALPSYNKLGNAGCDALNDRLERLTREAFPDIPQTATTVINIR